MTTWIKFKVYEFNDFIEAKYAIGDTNELIIKLITKVPKGDYYSCLNDACIKANELLNIEPETIYNGRLKKEIKKGENFLIRDRDDQIKRATIEKIENDTIFVHYDQDWMGKGTYTIEEFKRTIRRAD
jgi:hypothetical protein